MAKEKQGFIKLNRGFFDNFLWNEARTYSKAEAWLDLIQMARFEASTEIIGGKVIELQRGEIPASRRFLELRWNWGSTKVSNFLKMLTDFKMIKQALKCGQTTILLLNFGTYNDMQTIGKPPTNHRQTTDKPEANQNKELQEGKELNNISFKKETKEIPPDDLKKDVLVNLEIEEGKKVAPKKESEIVEFFNTTCTRLSKVQLLTEPRKKKIAARISEVGFEKVKEIITAVSESNFLNGENSRNWTAEFDWILEPKNFTKILEGNYKNKTNGNTTGNTLSKAKRRFETTAENGFN